MSTAYTAVSSGPLLPRAVEYYQPANYLPPDVNATVLLAEERLRMLQDEERRNRSRSKMLEDELHAKQAKVKGVTAQQDERRALLQALDEEILKKQQLVNRLTVDAEDRAMKLKPVEEQFGVKKQALESLMAQQDEMRRLLKRLEEELAGKQRALLAVGDHSGDMLEKQRVINDLLDQQRMLELELERIQKQTEDKEARSVYADTNTELMTSQADRQLIQLKLLEKEYRDKRDIIDKMQLQLEDAQSHHLDIQGKSKQGEKEIAKQRLELQQLTEETSLKRRAGEELVAQCSKVEADIERVEQEMQEYQALDDRLQQNRELKAQVAIMQQELEHSKLAVDQRTYKAKSLEAVIHVQRQKPEGGAFLSGSGMTVAVTSDPRQQLMQLLKRQEDRITRQQHLLAEKESRLRTQETAAAQEQHLREMLEHDLQTTLSQLHVEMARARAMQRAFELQGVKIGRFEVEREKGRQEDLIALMESLDPGLNPTTTLATGAGADSVWRQPPQAAQLLYTGPEDSAQLSKGSSLFTLTGSQMSA